MSTVLDELAVLGRKALPQGPWTCGDATDANIQQLLLTCRIDKALFYIILGVPFWNVIYIYNIMCIYIYMYMS
jgi:hypothetical protein